ncbi:MAG: VWA domain-containing protein [Dehalococcoidia bacterium]
MTLGIPWALLLLMPLAFLAARELRVRRASPALVVADLGPWRMAGKRPGWRIRLRALPLILRTLGIALVIVAFARPRQGLTITTIPEEGIDVVLTMDISSSMTSPLAGSRTTRLSAAKSVVGDFVGSLVGDRVGLVAFQARALTLSPLTADLEAIRTRISALDPGLLNDGTAIGLGLSEAVALVKDSPAKSRVIVLLTDGENNTGSITPVQAARVAQALDIRLYTIGFLGPGGEGVDRQMLTAIADATGGRYYDAQTQSELAAAYREISSLERSRLGERRFTRFREFAPWLAATAVGLLAMDGMLRTTWLRTQP